MNTKDLIRGLQRDTAQRLKRLVSTLFITVQVKEVYEENGKLYIKATSTASGTELTEMKLLSPGLGNGRGLIIYPKPADMGLALNILGEYFYLSSMFDEYTSSPDNQILTDKDSMFIINNDFGSYIGLIKNNDIILKTKTGAKIRLNNDGSFKTFNKDNYGIEVDSSGVLTLRGTNLDNTVNGNTTSAGTWTGL